MRTTQPADGGGDARSRRGLGFLLCNANRLRLEGDTDISDQNNGCTQAQEEDLVQAGLSV